MFPSRKEKPEQLRHRIQAIDHRCYHNSHARRFTIALQPPDYSYMHHRYGYTYQFQRARQQNDPVIRLIQRTILELNASSEHGCLMWNANIKVAPSTSAPPIWPLKSGGKNDVKFYTFFQDKKEFPATVPVSVIPREGELTKAKIHVRKAGIWMPIAEWLLQLAEQELLIFRGIESSNYQWRKRANVPFRLMNLPVELRLMIFQHHLTPAGKIYPLSKASKSGELSLNEDFANQHMTLGVGYSNDGKMVSLLHNCVSVAEAYEVVAYEARPNLAILRVSKAVTKEVLKAGWESTTKCFLHYRLFVPVLCSQIGAALDYNCLGRIELSFSPHSWFEFFGVSVKPTVHVTESSNMGHYLRRLRDNTHLQIRFRDPADGIRGDPWCGNSSPWDDEGDLRTTTCQTFLVSWILTFAYEHIRHMHVTISGFVRKPQKDDWNEIFHKARRGLPHEHDNEAALNKICKMPTEDLPPKCVCRKSCIRTTNVSSWGYSPLDNVRLAYDDFDFEDGPLCEYDPLSISDW